ncbi:MAG: hypothetical protein M3P13_12305 [Acidobacteriota bacterium]|jgi:hypothetical protein|nr:hypothetical protein [Acidobacteriota bacterium]
MMDDRNPFLPRAAFPPADGPAEPSPTPAPAQSPGLSPDASGQSPAVEKFKSCRWRATPDVGEFCTHRDVLPFAGKVGFVAESWCPECAFYKLRRTPKKRERVDFSY